jgi:predicted nucleotidyltransferase
VIVSRDIKFIETKNWNFKHAERSQSKEMMQDLGGYVDEAPVRGTRLLDDIYQSCNVAVLKPAEFEKAKNDLKWIYAIKEELRMIEKNQTWKLVDMSKHKKPIGVKWVYRTKLNADGTINKHKAILVIKGYT